MPVELSQSREALLANGAVEIEDPEATGRESDVEVGIALGPAPDPVEVAGGVMDAVTRTRMFPLYSQPALPQAQEPSSRIP